MTQRQRRNTSVFLSVFLCLCGCAIVTLDAETPHYTSPMVPAHSNSEPNPVVRFGRFIRRRWRRLRRRWLAPQVRFVYHDKYALTLDGTPVDPARGQKILGFLIDEGLLDRDDISVPRRPAVRSLLRAHDHDYIDSVGRDPEVTEKIFGARISDANIAKIVETQRLAVGDQNRFPRQFHVSMRTVSQS